MDVIDAILNAVADTDPPCTCGHQRQDHTRDNECRHAHCTCSEYIELEPMGDYLVN